MEHNVLLKMYVEEISKWPRLAFEHHPVISDYTPMYALSVISRFFSSTN
jgi:hypothetical protein